MLLQDSDVRVIVPEHAAMSVAVFRVLLALLRRGTNAQSVEVWKILRSGTNLKALIELVTANQIMWEEFNSGAKLMVILELLTETSPVHKPPERTLDILAHAALAVGKSLGFLQVRCVITKCCTVKPLLGVLNYLYSTYYSYELLLPLFSLPAA